MGSCKFSVDVAPKAKSELADELIDLTKRIKREMTHILEAVRSDQRTESDKNLSTRLKYEIILSQDKAPHIPTENDTSERNVRTVKEMTRCSLKLAH